MRKVFLLLAIHLCVLTISAQQELHIHHINIENGDATLIGIYDVAQQKYTSKILLDGGQVSANLFLLPYISKMVGTDQESFHFEYIILTHYHNDHYNGLLAIKNGQLTADSIIDPGGYTVSKYFNHTAVSGIRPPSMKLAKPWLNALTDAKDAPEPFVKGRSKIIIRYGATGATSIGNKITVGKIGSNDVELKCIAGWGNTLSSDGHIVRNPFPDKISQNNFTLAFILSCGEFRYFIGGDMGGQNPGSYIDQETTVTKYLADEYPNSISINGNDMARGHVCGFKGNHHGSFFSNKIDFMKGMRPSISITSAGNDSGWHLPSTDFLTRLSKVKPLSISTSLTGGTFNKGVYFTNLYNFPKGASKTKANTLFKNKAGVNYSFGNDSTGLKDSYLIKITDEAGIDDQSSFEVGRVNITRVDPYRRVALFVCHKK